VRLVCPQLRHFFYYFPIWSDYSLGRGDIQSESKIFCGIQESYSLTDRRMMVYPNF
jgi:hypothetical protein